jgi:hypothetical protein
MADEKAVASAKASRAADAARMGFSNGWRRGSVRLEFAQRDRKDRL